jgi:hypothetical protein
MLHKGHRFFTEDVNLIRSHFKDFCWTNFRTLTASIAFVRIDGNIPVARAILKTIIGYHCVCLSFPPLPAGRLSLSRLRPIAFGGRGSMIPLNEASGILFKRPSEAKVKEFQEILMNGGLTAIVCASTGTEISASCGQLQGKWPS